MLVSSLLVFVLAQQPPVAWPFDELTHTNGAVFKGMIVAESAEGIRFQVVIRTTGRPTVTLTTLFTPAEVGSVKRLSDPERATLKARLAELDPSVESTRMAAVRFENAEWLGRADGAKKYTSDHFILITDANDEIARRAAVRLEMLATALTRYFPPPRKTITPTTVYLCTRPDDYRQHLRGKAILNPAIFDPDGKRIVCGSNLKALGDQLTGTHLHHERQRQAIDEYEASIRTLYKDSKSDLERFTAIAAAERKKIAAAEAANDQTFDRATKQLFAVLYHEAFHAYWHASGSPALPRWLDEGLAQVFESAILEAGELRVDHADRDKLTAYLAKPVAFRDVLSAKSTDFLVSHAGDKAISDRVYRAAWAHAYMLLVARPVIGTDRYRTFLEVQSKDPVAAFENWVGMSVAEWDKKTSDTLMKLSATPAGRGSP